jgi:nucleotide-binding universal stress UspA family protein
LIDILAEAGEIKHFSAIIQAAMRFQPAVARSASPRHGRRRTRHGAFMYTRILVAVDGSHTSRRAFDAALNLAGSLGATLRPFYVVENTPMYFDAPGYDPSVLLNRLVEQGKELSTELAQAMRERGVSGDVAIGEASSVDDVPTLVLRAAAGFNADLIVMGTHGRRGVQRLILGSVAERCVRQSTLPVLLIPSAAGGEAAASEP